MKTIKLTEENFSLAIKEALVILKKGGVVVTPSESQYGLSANPSNEIAVKEIYAIKGRDFNKPLGLVAGSIKIINDYFLINDREQKFIDKFWPSPMGLELRIKDNETIKNIVKLTYGKQFDENQSGPYKKVIRVTSDKILAELSSGLGLPIISTSANISGQSACYDIECVQRQFKDNEVLPSLIIDAGILEPKPASTMLDLTGDKTVIIREGANFDEVQKFLKILN